MPRPTYLSSHSSLHSCTRAADFPIWRDSFRGAPGAAHLIGIAGSGMRSLARVLRDWGWEVSGSDVAAPEDGAIAPSATVYKGHSARHIPARTDLVVYSDATAADNPERCRAAALKLPCLSYFECLGSISRQSRTAAIAGTHGKSTVTAMTATMLAQGGHDLTAIYGAEPLDEDIASRGGRGELMLVEACEYRENFLSLRAQVAAILSIESDHFDYYRSPEQLERAFAALAASLPETGLLLIPHDCAPSRRAAAAAHCPIQTFGLECDADWNAHDLYGPSGRYRFTIRAQGADLCEVQLQVPGRHQVANAVAAAALAASQGATATQITQGLQRFRGLKRRLEYRGDRGGVALFDDYAHHPTEVAAGLQALRKVYPGRRLWCVFQPHQASRTAALLDELAASLHNADMVLVAEVFRAREPPWRAGEVRAADLASAVRATGAAVPALHATEEIVACLRNRLRPDDVVVTMGAGDIRKVHDGLIDGI